MSYRHFAQKIIRRFFCASCTIDKKEYAILVKGDSEVNETKVLKLLNKN